ncbi:unnamed protein product [Gulo gulo]|uniref:Uncharacterized protein n=1 Tax=Gulo gulo TaxID=48420 RepID=A0A9X9LQJ2_GULGU|nr:unnamed protein product [Gulo gulo]
MATFFLAPVDGFSTPSTPTPPARTLHLIFVALNSPKTGSSFSHLSVSEGPDSLRSALRKKQLHAPHLLKN